MSECRVDQTSIGETRKVIESTRHNSCFNKWFLVFSNQIFTIFFLFAFLIFCFFSSLWWEGKSADIYRNLCGNRLKATQYPTLLVNSGRKKNKNHLINQFAEWLREKRASELINSFSFSLGAWVWIESRKFSVEIRFVFPSNYLHGFVIGNRRDAVSGSAKERKLNADCYTNHKIVTDNFAFYRYIWIATWKRNKSAETWVEAKTSPFAKHDQLIVRWKERKINSCKWKSFSFSVNSLTWNCFIQQQAIEVIDILIALHSSIHHANVRSHVFALLSSSSLI